MAEYAVVQAVEARVAAVFDECPVYVENGLTTPPADNSAWLMVQFPYAISTWQTTDGDFLEEGAIRFVLSVERGAGAHEGRQWMTALAAQFRGVQFDGVQTYAPSSPVSDDMNDDSSYYKLSFAVPYEYIVTG